MSFGGEDINQLLNRPFSALYKVVIGAEEQKELHIVFNKHVLPQKPKHAASYLDVLIQKARPAKNIFKKSQLILLRMSRSLSAATPKQATKKNIFKIIMARNPQLQSNTKHTLQSS
jgi:hypothetical protein